MSDIGRKAVPGYEGFYEVDESGLVYSLAREIKIPRGRGTRFRPEIVMRLSSLKCGYLRVFLCVDGSSKQHSVHRLVCAAFHGAPDGFRNNVNHKNGKKTDNRAANLEWVTASENVRHAFHCLGRIPKTKPVMAIDPKTGLEWKRYPSIAAAGADGFAAENISHVIAGRLKKTGGMMWRLL